ncbi:MAG: hypothetical protein QS721_03955 [Candidatus Endonucleobacter sp. (ex Gigantidas childressi)]|nr:hypothetical protein [Candidatus Endonucleobacter sp. (ex Gigantidas childressi)]
MSTQTRQYKQLTQGQRYQIEALLGIDYFAKPYASYQRRTNKNTNGIIRRT